MTTEPITHEERQRRIDSVAYARTSLALEGVQFSKEAEQDQQSFIDGAISAEELSNRVKQRLSKMRGADHV